MLVLVLEVMAFVFWNNNIFEIILVLKTLFNQIGFLCGQNLNNLFNKCYYISYMKSYKNLERGFTLIELLVVIAIIGILSGIVITALSGARSKASEAEIKSNLSGFRTAAELVYIDNGNSYEAVCTDPNTAPYLAALPDLGAGCVPDVQDYALSATLNAEGDSWCVDSRGFTGSGTNGGSSQCSASAE